MQASRETDQVVRDLALPSSLVRGTNLFTSRISYDLTESLRIGTILTHGDPEALRNNTFAGQRLLGQLEVDQIRVRFLERIDEHPAMREALTRRRLIEEIQRIGCADFLPRTLRSSVEIGL